MRTRSLPAAAMSTHPTICRQHLVPNPDVLIDGTNLNYTTVYLQRLANPLMPWERQQQPLHHRRPNAGRPDVLQRREGSQWRRGTPPPCSRAQSPRLIHGGATAPPTWFGTRSAIAPSSGGITNLIPPLPKSTTWVSQQRSEQRGRDGRVWAALEGKQRAGSTVVFHGHWNCDVGIPRRSQEPVSMVHVEQSALCQHERIDAGSVQQPVKFVGRFRHMQSEAGTNPYRPNVLPPAYAVAVAVQALD